MAALVNPRGKSAPDATLEARSRALGFRLICGVDEAGRGPLAGPVVAAAVILPLWRGKGSGPELPAALAGLNDSKQLSPTARAALFASIVSLAHVSIATASEATIKNLNIRGATLAAMGRAVGGLSPSPDFALIDGKDEPAGLPCAGASVVKGDARALSIAAASICAKVARDRMMDHADTLYPGYGFADHKGYATPVHLQALARLGPSPIHRRDFAPVRAARESQLEARR